MNQPELLRHVPTGDIYVFQPELARRKDMEPVEPATPAQLTLDFGPDHLLAPDAPADESEQVLPESAPAEAADIERTLQMISDIPADLAPAEQAPTQAAPEPAPEAAATEARPARKRARNAT